MSLRVRLLAASLVLVAVGLAVADIATYSSLHSFLYSRVDAQLDGAHRSAERALYDSQGVFLRAQLTQLGTVVPGVWLQVRDDDGDALATVQGREFTPQVPANLATLVATGSPQSVS